MTLAVDPTLTLTAYADAAGTTAISVKQVRATKKMQVLFDSYSSLDTLDVGVNYRSAATKQTNAMRQLPDEHR